MAVSETITDRVNTYQGHCRHCQVVVLPGDGFLVKFGVSTTNPRGTWGVIHCRCRSTYVTVLSTPATEPFEAKVAAVAACSEGNSREEQRRIAAEAASERRARERDKQAEDYKLKAALLKEKIDEKKAREEQRLAAYANDPLAGMF